MKNQILIAIVVLMIRQLSCHAEIINGPANVRDHKNGKILFELYDSISINIDQADSIWFYLELLVHVNKKNLTINKNNNRFYIKDNSVIFNEEFKPIGKTKCKIETFPDDATITSDTAYFLRGYTFHENIYSNSIPEVQLSTLIASRASFIKDFENHIKKNNYKEYENKNKFNIYHLNGVEILGSPPVRIALIFYNDSLFAIISKNVINEEKSVKSEFLAGQKRYPIRYFVKDDVRLKIFKKIFLRQYAHAD